MTVTPVFATGEQELTPTWTTYLDVKKDVRPWLQASDVPGTADTEAKLRLYTESACWWVQNYLGKPIGATTIKRRFSGWSGFNGAYLPLPYYPVLKVNKVIEWWGVSGPHELKEQTPAEQVGAEAFQIDNTLGYLIRTFQGLVQRPWFPGSKNIEVEWEAGFNPVPPDLKTATLQLVAHRWRREQQASVSGSPVPLGTDPEMVAPGYFGEPPEVRQTLDTWKQVGIG